MSIDESVFSAVSKAFIHEDNKLLRQILGVYEAAKASGQPGDCLPTLNQIWPGGEAEVAAFKSGVIDEQPMYQHTQPGDPLFDGAEEYRLHQEAVGAQQMVELNDEIDQWSHAIIHAHPSFTDDHATYEMALKMVSNRHSKGMLVDLVNWLLSISKSPKRESGWQLIETAPKDGSTVLLWNDYAEVFTGFFGHKGWQNRFLGVDGNHFPAPSHWMPLPEKPRRGSGA